MIDRTSALYTSIDRCHFGGRALVDVGWYMYTSVPYTYMMVILGTAGKIELYCAYRYHWLLLAWDRHKEPNCMHVDFREMT